jgi:hypothetical protein
LPRRGRIQARIRRESHHCRLPASRWTCRLVLMR